MTDNELSWLLIGVNLGVMLMLAMHLIGQAVDAHRSVAAAEVRLTRARKSLATDDWREVLTARERA